MTSFMVVAAEAWLPGAVSPVEPTPEHCHLPCMIEKASPAGWVVQAAISLPPPRTKSRWLGPNLPDAPSIRYFNVAIAMPDKAAEAVTKHLAKVEVEDTILDVRAIRKLSAAEIDSIGLVRGELRPA